MTQNLSRGQNLSLTKAAPSLQVVRIGLGWDPRASDGQPFDLDASALLVDSNGTLEESGFVFYNQLRSADGSVVHLGDNRTGNAAGDDESITINLARLPAAIDKVVVAVSIHESAARQQNFGMVGKAFIRILDDERNVEIARYDLSEEASNYTCMVFGELYRYANEFKFRAVGQGYTEGLSTVLTGFGLQLGGG